MKKQDFWWNEKSGNFLLLFCDINEPISFKLTFLNIYVGIFLFYLMQIIMFIYIKKNKINKIIFKKEILYKKNILLNLINEYEIGNLTKEELLNSLYVFLYNYLIDSNNIITQTSKEIIAKIADIKNISSKNICDIQNLLQFCDKVKFSRYQLTEEDINWAIKIVYDITAFNKDVK